MRRARLYVLAALSSAPLLVPPVPVRITEWALGSSTPADYALVLSLAVFWSSMAVSALAVALNLPPVFRAHRGSVRLPAPIRRPVWICRGVVAYWLFLLGLFVWLNEQADTINYGQYGLF